jgi:hypothetical protein
MSQLRPLSMLAVASAFPNSAGAPPDGSSLLLFSNPLSTHLSVLHPSPLHIFRLWQAFLDNVNPLRKIVHAPTFQCRILGVTGNITSIPQNVEALAILYLHGSYHFLKRRGMRSHDGRNTTGSSYEVYYCGATSFRQNRIAANL